MNVSTFRKEACMGCGMCSNVCPKNAIEMRANDEGFLEPHILTDRCIDCSLCVKKCILSEKTEPSFPTNTQCYAAIHQNNDIQKQSSSGGVFYALACRILEQGGCVVGAALDSDMKLSAKIADSVESLNPLMGSKYIQSDTGNIYKLVSERLNKGQKVLFSGTPCQCVALDRYLTNAQKEQLLLCAVFCHGVPSQKAFDSYLKELQRKYKSKAVSVSFRDKTEGWNRYSMKIVFENGETYISPANTDPYLRCMINNIILRKSCFQCKAKHYFPFDIEIGDFWGVDSTAHTNSEDGVSAVVVYTKKGEDLLRSCSELRLEHAELSEILNKNMAIKESVQPHKNRDVFYKRLRSHNFYSMYFKYMYEFYEPLGKRMSNKIKLFVKKRIGR